jgi:hypothetical protein
MVTCAPSGCSLIISCSAIFFENGTFRPVLGSCLLFFKTIFNERWSHFIVGKRSGPHASSYILYRVFEKGVPIRLVWTRFSKCNLSSNLVARTFYETHCTLAVEPLKWLKGFENSAANLINFKAYYFGSQREHAKMAPGAKSLGLYFAKMLGQELPILNTQGLRSLHQSVTSPSNVIRWQSCWSRLGISTISNPKAPCWFLTRWLRFLNSQSLLPDPSFWFRLTRTNQPNHYCQICLLSGCE